MMTDKYGKVFTFIICTGLSQNEAGEVSHDADAAGFLCKPYKSEAVLGMIRSLTGTHTAAKAGSQ